jgi:hypothetical protein
MTLIADAGDPKLEFNTPQFFELISEGIAHL